MNYLIDKCYKISYDITINCSNDYSSSAYFLLCLLCVYQLFFPSTSLILCGSIDDDDLSYFSVTE